MSTDTSINISLPVTKSDSYFQTRLLGRAVMMLSLSPILLSPDAEICSDVFTGAIIAGDSDGACLVKSENATS